MGSLFAARVRACSKNNKGEDSQGCDAPEGGDESCCY